MLVESSKDILYLVIALCILWVTVFLCWVFYYVMRLLRNVSEIVEEFRLRLQALTDAINYIRDRVEHISDFMTVASSGVGGFVKKVVTKKANQWLDKSSAGLNDAAKDAVDKAVKATAKKMKKAAAKLRQE